MSRLLALAVLLALLSFFSPRGAFAADLDLAQEMRVPEVCMADAEKIDSAWDQFARNMSYRRAVFHFEDNPLTTGQKELSKIFRILKSALKSNSDCFGPLASYYAISSVRLSGVVIDQSFNQMVLVRIYASGHLRFVTPADRQRLGGKWKARSGAQKKPLIIGAYDCASSTIYVDPFNAPSDLGALLIHELDHFFRDKLIDSTTIGIPVAHFVLLDETFAALHAGHLQVSDICQSIEGSLDRNLFDPKGSLASIFEEFNVNGRGCRMPGASVINFAEFVKTAILDIASRAHGKDFEPCRSGVFQRSGT